MERAQHHPIVSQAYLHAMSEARSRSQLQHLRDAVQGKAAQADDDFPLEQSHLSLEIRQTVVALLWRGSVFRRRAADAGGDVGTVELQSVVAAGAGGLVGK